MGKSFWPKVWVGKCLDFDEIPRDCKSQLSIFWEWNTNFFNLHTLWCPIWLNYWTTWSSGRIKSDHQCYPRIFNGKPNSFVPFKSSKSLNIRARIFDEKPIPISFSSWRGQLKDKNVRRKFQFYLFLPFPDFFFRNSL